MNTITTTNTLEPISNRRIFVNQMRNKEVKNDKTYQVVLNRRILEMVSLGE